MAIRFEKVSHIYSPKTPFEFKALSDIDLELAEGKITALIGATGSGKSTLVQHLNALLLPSEGKMTVGDFTVEANKKFNQTKPLRKEVGLVFQFSEYQLFEETVLKDAAFGPKNFGVSEEEATKLAYAALQTVGLAASEYNKSPLELSGGQKRRVAIAGVLAMQPKILVLDEPTAGLDPQGAINMMELFKKINKQTKTTIIIVTHNMEHVLQYCDDVVVMEKGKCIFHDTATAFFESDETMERARINPPSVIQFRKRMNELGVNLPKDLFTVEELAKAIRRAKK